MADEQTTTDKADKPTLHLAKPSAMTHQHVLDLFEKLTGRKATPEEEAESLKVWNEEWMDEAKSAAEKPSACQPGFQDAQGGSP